MQQLNQIQDWETEMDKLEHVHKDIHRLRGELESHDFIDGLRCLIIVGVVCAAWYFRAV